MRSKDIFAVILIVIGVLLMVNQFGLEIYIGGAWPLFLLIPGVLFWIAYLSSRAQRDNYGLLIPGTILIVYSVYFFILEITGGNYAAEFSFLFTFGIGLAFFAAHYMSRAQPKGLKIAGWILTVISIITLISTLSRSEWWPGVLILIGVVLLLQRGSKIKQPTPRPPRVTPASDGQSIANDNSQNS